MAQTEISWSLMHPTALDVEYMRRVISQAARFRVDSFEICAECHSPSGGLDGLVLYEDYPAVNASLERTKILSNRQRLREILALVHSAGKPVYYWHREVTVWRAFLQAVPELRDANGEFDLLGNAFAKLLRYKIRRAFEAVPELDGLVVTLTEADFSAIHNSTPEIYPPVAVVEHVASIFAEELHRRGKRFILRSFGSIAQDYQDILAGAALVAHRYAFEIETKVTPYDFNPFLPDNPFLRKIPGLTLSAECDSVGEFLGAGYLPAENIENIVRYVRYSQKCGVDRFVIRVDRGSNDIFSTYPINLDAYMQAIEHPEWTAEEIARHYAEAHYPAICARELLALGVQGCELVKHLHYIDGHVIFHQFPPQADFKWLRAGGIFAVFKDHVPLAQLEGIWSILSHKTTPGRPAILAEKELARALAQDGLDRILKLQSSLPEADYNRLHRQWSNAVVAATAVLSFVRCVAAYFDDMEVRRPDPISLCREIARAEEELAPFLKDRNFVVADKQFINGLEHDIFIFPGDDLDAVYVQPLLGLCRLLQDEYRVELTARREWENIPGLLDLILPGAFTDDWRCGRYMHGSHAAVIDGRPVRIVGNQVFPNGFVKFSLAGTDTPVALVIHGRNGPFLLNCNGVQAKGDFGADGSYRLTLPPAQEVNVTMRKATTKHPTIRAIATIKS